jgi:hypothetical protein
MIGSKAQAVCVLLLLALSTANAQTGTTRPIEPRLEVAAGGGFFRGSALGARDANLRANDAQASPLRLFSTDTDLAGVPFFEGRVGYRLTRRLDVEGRFTRSRPELRTSLSADVESAAALTAVETLDHYLIEAGVTVMLDEFRFGGTVPFVSGGAGYVRQLHEGQTLINQGRDYYVGGGVKHVLVARPRATLKVLGVRAEATLRVLDGDVVFDERVRRLGLSGSLFVAF